MASLSHPPGNVGTLGFVRNRSAKPRDFWFWLLLAFLLSAFEPLASIL
jgi:hypothetical protein